MKHVGVGKPVSKNYTNWTRWTLHVIAVTVIVGLVGNLFSDVFASGLSQQSTQPSTEKPIDEVIMDLQSFIPAYMDEQGIPGLSIALIRNGRVVWIEGYGVANSITHQPVTPDTIFEVASNSKVVTAYIALRLVDQGLLSLDEPLNGYLTDPWLPPSEYRDTITLRQVLSHSSGLGHNTLNREVNFHPGSGYSYSAIGFLYTQAVIEHITGRSLEELAQDMVFVPLGMKSSSFVNIPSTRSRMANGHLPAVLPVILFLIPFIAGLLVFGLIGLVILRICTGNWHPNQRQIFVIIFGGLLIASLTNIILFSKIGMLQYGLLSVLCGLALVGSFTLALLILQKVFMLILPRKQKHRRLFIILFAGLILISLGFLAFSIGNLPVPKDTTVHPDAAGTMRTTAAELATFLIELSNPRYLSQKLANELCSPQIRLSEDLSWGLGPGIQHSSMGDALWQWGQALDYQSVMIIYTETGSGVVVLTNSDFLNPDVAIDIAHHALGGKIDPIRRASHLLYNQQGPFLEDH